MGTNLVDILLPFNSMIFDRFVIDNYLKYTLPYLEYFRVREGYCVISTKKIDFTPGYSKLHEFELAVLDNLNSGYAILR